jgi:lactoylglutathione lyase
MGADRPEMGGAAFRDAFPILEVADVSRSLVFYRDKLGFRQTYSFPEDGDPVYVALELEGGGKLALGGPKDAVESGSTAIWLYTDDVDAAVERLRGSGVKVISEPTDQPWGERVASVVDPDGYTVHIGAEAAG